MEVATIDESRAVARLKYAEYLRAVKERHTAEYEALKNGYRELAKGNQVIDIVETMRRAGLDGRGRPRLAIIRADAKLCWYRWTRLRSTHVEQPTFSMTNSTSSYLRRSQCVQMPRSTFDRQPSDRWTNRAIVPTIPPALMPKANLSRYHILWEAEWEQVPVDPMLLKHLGKTLYVVLAHWDLTPLEQAILRDSQT